MELEALREEMAAALVRGGVAAAVSWPQGRRQALEGPVVLVSLRELRCSPAGMQDYLGLRQDPDSGAWEELYGRRAEATFALTVAARPADGAEKCRETFAAVTRILQRERPAGLAVRELRGGEVEYDRQEGILRLSAEVKCCGWLYEAGEEGGSFLEFVLRGDVKG